MTDPIVGIDLGTSNTVVAHADSAGMAVVLADANGYKIHPSVVSFHPSGGVVVGAAAKQRKVIDPKNTIYSVKRLIGRGFSSREVQTAVQRSPFQIKQGANQLPLIVTRGGEFAVPEISAIVLDHAKNVATSALKTDVTRAVVTVPASFNDAQRSATATAGSIAGLEVMRVLNEPTAAALAYGHTRNLNEIIAVYDFGGGTFDITILRLADQVYEVLGTAGDSFLGGDDLDERIVDRMVSAFLAEHRVDLRTNEVSMMRLRAVAEQTKIELSRRSRAVVRVDEIAYGPKGKAIDLQIEIRRDEFVSQVADIIDQTFPVCAESLKLAGLSVGQIDDIILVGGTTKIPYVREQVATFFGKEPRADISPEDAVALGAALQASALDAVLSRKSPQRAPVSDDAITRPRADAAAAMMPVPSTDSDLDFDSAFDTNFGQTFESSTPPPAAPRAPERAPERATERPVQRGAHHDSFPAPKPAVPAGPVIGRLTKPAPARTSIGMPIVAPPSVPAAASGAPRTAPRVSAQRAPAKPAPAAPPRVDAALDLDDDIGFPNLPTDKGIVDLDLEPPPSSTMKGFPAAAPARASAPPAALPPQMFPVMPAAPVPSPVVLDVTPRGLGIGTVAGFCEELIRRNSRVPTEMRKLFTTSRDDQDAVRIVVVQGESRRMTQNTVIADLRLENLPPRPRGETSIEVTFLIDANGILQVRARDPQTGRDTRASLDIVGSLPDQDVDASRERLQALRR